MLYSEEVLKGIRDYLSVCFEICEEYTENAHCSEDCPLYDGGCSGFVCDPEFVEKSLLLVEAYKNRWHKGRPLNLDNFVHGGLYILVRHSDVSPGALPSGHYVARKTTVNTLFAISLDGLSHEFDLRRYGVDWIALQREPAEVQDGQM